MIVEVFGCGSKRAYALDVVGRKPQQYGISGSELNLPTVPWLMKDVQQGIKAG